MKEPKQLLKFDDHPVALTPVQSDNSPTRFRSGNKIVASPSSRIRNIWTGNHMS